MPLHHSQLATSLLRPQHSMEQKPLDRVLSNITILSPETTPRSEVAVETGAVETGAPSVAAPSRKSQRDNRRS